MRFAKYQGIGNDFVMLSDPRDELELTPGLVRRLCDRRFGIGADGVIRAAPAKGGADLVMDYVNSDGSVGEMCGNGIRCLALFARAEGLADAAELAIETRAGIKQVEILHDDRVRVDMGVPAFRPEEVPVAVGGEDALHTKIDIDSSAATSGGRVPNGGTELGVEPHVVEAACLSMGNPHAVLFVDDPASAPVTTLGPALERHQLFPHRVNVEFVRVDAPDHVTMRVWERGSGETLACGTGACAAAVAARLLAGGAPQTTVFLRGGSVEISWDGGLGVPAPVVMTGSAAETYRGEFDLEAYG